MSMRRSKILLGSSKKVIKMRVGKQVIKLVFCILWLTKVLGSLMKSEVVASYNGQKQL